MLILEALEPILGTVPSTIGVEMILYIFQIFVLSALLGSVVRLFALLIDIFRKGR